MKNLVRLILLAAILFVFITGPSEKRQMLRDDGPYLCAEISPEPSLSPVPVKEPIIYARKEIVYEGAPQVLHILELDLSNPGLEIIPVLARDQIFGFEFLSDIDKRYKAAATINAGFNYAYGQPSGMVIQNGKLISSSRGYGRILLIEGGKARFVPPPFRVWLETEDTRIPVDLVNPYPYEKGIMVFTPEYGPTNRMDTEYAACVVVNGTVQLAGIVSGELDIPDDGFVIADLNTEHSPILGLSSGRSVRIMLQEQVQQGYQCSGSLVENGENVAKDRDEWAGNLNLPTPRTAVGIKDDNTLVFLVVDGRQPGYSTGVTGRQLADILISLGVTEAALLDGGASSELIYNGKIVNRPSTGKERLLASAFVVKYNSD